MVLQPYNLSFEGVEPFIQLGEVSVLKHPHFFIKRGSLVGLESCLQSFHAQLMIAVVGTGEQLPLSYKIRQRQTGTPSVKKPPKQPLNIHFRDGRVLHIY